MGLCRALNVYHLVRELDNAHGFRQSLLNLVFVLLLCAWVIFEEHDNSLSGISWCHTNLSCVGQFYPETSAVSWWWFFHEFHCAMKLRGYLLDKAESKTHAGAKRVAAATGSGRE